MLDLAALKRKLTARPSGSAGKTLGLLCAGFVAGIMFAGIIAIWQQQRMINIVKSNASIFNYTDEEVKELFEPRLRVVDGDTIKINGNAVRIKGYDTPETYRPACAEEKRKGLVATNKLTKLLKSGTVRIEWDRDKDRYGRLLARIYVNGTDIATTATKQGWARAYDGKSAREGWC